MTVCVDESTRMQKENPNVLIPKSQVWFCWSSVHQVYAELIEFRQIDGVRPRARVDAINFFQQGTSVRIFGWRQTTILWKRNPSTFIRSTAYNETPTVALNPKNNRSPKKAKWISTRPGSDGVGVADVGRVRRQFVGTWGRARRLQTFEFRSLTSLVH